MISTDRWKSKDWKYIQAVNLVVEDLKALHPEVKTSPELARRACQCFESNTFPEDGAVCALATGVIQHLSLVINELSVEHAMVLLPLGLQLYAELELDAKFARGRPAFCGNLSARAGTGIFIR